MHQPSRTSKAAAASISDVSRAGLIFIGTHVLVLGAAILLAIAN